MLPCLCGHRECILRVIVANVSCTGVGHDSCRDAYGLNKAEDNPSTTRSIMIAICTNLIMKPNAIFASEFARVDHHTFLMPELWSPPRHNGTPASPFEQDFESPSNYTGQVNCPDYSQYNSEAQTAAAQPTTWKRSEMSSQADSGQIEQDRIRHHVLKVSELRS
jgi:hypothetical protein